MKCLLGHVFCRLLWAGSSLVWRGRISAGQSDGGQVPNQRRSSGGIAVSELPPGEGAICTEKQPGHSELWVSSHPHPAAAGSTKGADTDTCILPHHLCLGSVSVQSQILMVTEKLNSMQAMIRNREQCLRKLADVQIRPIQLVAPRPEPDPTSQRCKSPLFSPKHGTTCFHCTPLNTSSTVHPSCLRTLSLWWRTADILSYSFSVGF